MSNLEVNIAYPADQEDGLVMPGFLVRNTPVEQQQPDASAETPSKKSWRDILPVHPACAAFPDLSHDELIALGEDIKKNGLRQAIVVVREGAWPNHTFRLLDGKNRLNAMELAGIDFEIEIRQNKETEWTGVVVAGNWRSTMDVCPMTTIEGLDNDSLVALALSLNAHRRHLTAEQKRDLIETLIKADPTKSNRQIAKAVKASHPHVAKVREKLEKAGDVETVTTSIDTKGRVQRARKAKAKSKLSAAKDAQVARDRQECVALNQKVIQAEKEPHAEHPEPKAISGQTIITADERKAQYAVDESARIESEQLANVLANADFGADVVVESPPIANSDGKLNFDDVELRQRLKELGAKVGSRKEKLGFKLNEHDRADKAFDKLYRAVSEDMDCLTLGVTRVLRESYKTLGPGVTRDWKDCLRSDAKHNISELRTLLDKIEAEIADLLR